MRSRREIEEDINIFNDLGRTVERVTERNTKIIIQLLLDIRDLLAKEKE